MEKVNAMTEKQVEEFCNAWPSGYKKVNAMTEKQIKQLETAGKKLEKCGGDCRHCDKCHIYTRWTERAGYMAVGCDLLPSELYDYIASVPAQLHTAAVELVKFELS